MNEIAQPSLSTASPAAATFGALATRRWRFDLTATERALVGAALASGAAASLWLQWTLLARPAWKALLALVA